MVGLSAVIEFLPGHFELGLDSHQVLFFLPDVIDEFFVREKTWVDSVFASVGFHGDYLFVLAPRHICSF